MHRFRKKSDAKQPRSSPLPFGQVVAPSPVPFPPPAPRPRPPGSSLALPQLSEINDFRSSVIIPSLSRRFTLLRESQGDATFDSLRSKFAEQRAAGAANQITEEEEDLMLDALDHISRGAAAASEDTTDDFTLSSYYASAGGPLSGPATPHGGSSYMPFPRSPSSSSPMSASPSSRAVKRHSNNLFGSGGFRDARYIRNARATSTTSQTSMSTASRARYLSGESTSSTVTSPTTIVHEPSSSTLASIRFPDEAPKEEEESQIGDESVAVGQPVPFESSASADEDGPHLSLPILSPQQRRISLAVEAALLSMTADDDDIVIAPRPARPPSTGKPTNGLTGTKPSPLQPSLFSSADIKPESLSPRSAVSEDFDSASAFWSRDDDPFSAQNKERDTTGRNPMSSPASPSFGSSGPASAPAGAQAFAAGMRPTSPARADSTTPRAISPPPFRGHGAPAVRSNAAPQIPSNVLPRSALPRNDSPAPGMHAQSKSSSSFGSLFEIARGISAGHYTLDDDEHPSPAHQLSARPVSPPQAARSPTPHGSANGSPAWMAGAAYYHQQHRSIDRAGAATPDYSRERRPSTTFSEESAIIDPFRASGGRRATSPPGRPSMKSGASVRSLSSPPLPDSPILDGPQPPLPTGVDYGSLTGLWDDAQSSGVPYQIQYNNRADVGGGGSRPTTPRSPPFLARSPSRTGYGQRGQTPEPDYATQQNAAAAAMRQIYSSTPPPAPSPGIGRLRTLSRSRYHSPTSSASSSFNNINAETHNPLVLAPFNASAASVASAGSSFHSDAGVGVDDEALAALLIPDVTTRKRKWDDFTGDPAAAPRKVFVQMDDEGTHEERDPAEVVDGVLGIRPEDLLAIQDMLWQSALRYKTTVEAPPKRAPSLRRRRGSIGESISSRTTSPAPGAQHVSPKSSLSPFNPAASSPNGGLSPQASYASPARTFSPPPPPSAPTSPGPEAPSSPGPLTGSDTEREKTPAPRNQSHNSKSSDRGRALLTSMMESIESRKNLQPAPVMLPPQRSSPQPPVAQPPTQYTHATGNGKDSSPPQTPQKAIQPPGEQRKTGQPAQVSLNQVNFARPLSPQFQSSSRAMSPVPAVNAFARARSPPPTRILSPSPPDSPLRAKSPPVGTKPHHSMSASQSSDVSSILRNQALADAIFGNTEEDQPVSAAQAQSVHLPHSRQVEDVRDIQWAPPSPQQRSQSPLYPGHASPSPVPQNRYASPSPGPYDYSQALDQYDYPSPNKRSYNSSSSPLPAPDDPQLEQDVRRKVEMATAQLKQSSSQVSLRERSNSMRRRRIDPSKISGPQLMSASTSVETMPSLSPSGLASPGDAPRSAGSKLSQRFKKFGTWRNKPATPNSTDELQPFGHGRAPTSASPFTPTSSQTSASPFTPTSSQTSQTSSAQTPSMQNSNSMRINAQMGLYDGPMSASLADVSQFRFPPNSPGNTPPASAGPAFKSFMSRLGKPFGSSQTDLSSPVRTDRDRFPQPGNNGYRSPSSPDTPRYGAQVRSPSELRHVESPEPSRYPGRPPLGHELSSRGRASIDDAGYQPPELALQQIFDAASQAGLDPDAMDELSALLNRSMSTSSRMTTNGMPLSQAYGREPLSDRPISPPAAVERRTTVRTIASKSQGHGTRARDEDTRSIVVRRTIYLATDSNGNGQMLARRPSHASHKRQGSDTAFSMRSGKSVHDRVNTPPPKALQRSMSANAPPMPQFGSSYLDAPGVASGNSNSSVIDMYGSDSRGGTPARDRHLSISPYPSSQRSGPGAVEGQQALEVLELADGRVVWQIVDGLRDDFDLDSEPDFRSRASFASDYSLQDREDLTLHLREHKRMPSKGSTSSSNMQRRPTLSRPQTKVFYSDAEHIGRLIESMTHGLDSGSFTVQNNAPPLPTNGRGSLDADGNWTMEEHLEHVLQHVSPKTPTFAAAE